MAITTNIFSGSLQSLKLFVRFVEQSYAGQRVHCLCFEWSSEEHSQKRLIFWANKLERWRRLDGMPDRDSGCHNFLGIQRGTDKSWIHCAETARRRQDSQDLSARGEIKWDGVHSDGGNLPEKGAIIWMSLFSLPQAKVSRDIEIVFRSSPS